jgi:hypothetical protein
MENIAVNQINLCKSALLAKLLAGKTQKMTRAAIDKHLRSEKIAKHLNADDAAIQLALDELAGGQILTHKKGKTGGSYTATDAAVEFLKTLPLFPPLPPVDRQLKSFILMGMLAVGDRWLLRKELKGLITPTIAKTLGFSKDAVTPLMTSLLIEKSVEEQDPGKSGKDDRVSYHLTAHGTTQLAQGEQHPLAMFKLSGAALNELLRAGGAGLNVGRALPAEALDGAVHVGSAPRTENAPDAASAPRTEAAPDAASAPRTENVVAAEPVRSADPTESAVDATPEPAAPLTDDALLDEAKNLLRDRHSHTGLVPIFELRHRVKVQFGDLAASHEELDGRLRRLRREHRVRLVSISDRSQATAEQLSDSVPGEDEMFYYVGELQ